MVKNLTQLTRKIAMAFPKKIFPKFSKHRMAHDRPLSTKKVRRWTDLQSKARSGGDIFRRLFEGVVGRLSKRQGVGRFW
jgi:hypothetical protein